MRVWTNLTEPVELVVKVPVDQNDNGFRCVVQRHKSDPDLFRMYWWPWDQWPRTSQIKYIRRHSGGFTESKRLRDLLKLVSEGKRP